MRNIDLQIAFETEINLINDNIRKPLAIDTQYWLNAGVDKFYKTRYSGINFKREGFEQSQKRTDDLRTLVVKAVEEPVTEQTDVYEVKLPNDYVLLLGDTAGIVPLTDNAKRCWDKDKFGNYVIKYSDTIEGTIETIDRIRENSLSEYRLHHSKAKPIRLIVDNSVYLYTDGNYAVEKYEYYYLRLPKKIDILNNPLEQYTDMPEHTIPEIVKLAAQLYIENQMDQRYQTYPNEVSQME